MEKDRLHEFRNGLREIANRNGVPEEASFIETYFISLNAPMGRTMEGYISWRQEVNENFKRFGNLFGFN